MAIGIYFRTAYERIKANFRDKKYDPLNCYFEIRADMFPQAEWSNMNPKDVVIGCLKFISEDLKDITILDVAKEHKFCINRSDNKCEIIIKPLYILIQNYNTYDYCTVHCHHSDAAAEEYYTDIRITAFIVDTICQVLAFAYQNHYYGRSKYNL